MRGRAQLAVDVPLLRHLDDPEGASWFVYLFALADCTAFKVGFSCNPLQRICTFSRRYFQRFDLSQSILVRLPDCDSARAMEATIKSELAAFRAEPPEWIPAEAGGGTEWFSAVHFTDAERCARECMPLQSGQCISGAFEFFRTELGRVSTSFEPWAFQQAQRTADARAAARRGYVVKDPGLALRDWWDAYRYFDVPLFCDDPEAREFVAHSAGRATSADF